jgi:hypothetical protein
MNWWQLLLLFIVLIILALISRKLGNLFIKFIEDRKRNSSI